MNTTTTVSEFIAALKTSLTKEPLGITNSPNSFFKGVSHNTGWFSKVSVGNHGIDLYIPPMSYVALNGRKLIDTPQVCIYADRVLQEIHNTTYSREATPCVLLLTNLDLGSFLIDYRQGFFKNKKIFDSCYHICNEEMTSGSIVGWMMDNAFIHQSIAQQSTIEQFASKLALMISAFCKEISTAFERAGLSLVLDMRFSNMGTKRPKGTELAVYLANAFDSPADKGRTMLTRGGNSSWFLLDFSRRQLDQTNSIRRNHHKIRKQLSFWRDEDLY